MTAVTNWLNLNVFKQYSLLLFCSGGQKANNGSQWTKTKVWTELCASGGSREESLTWSLQFLEVPTFLTWGPIQESAHFYFCFHHHIPSRAPLFPFLGSGADFIHPPGQSEIISHLKSLLPQKISCSQLWVVQLAHLWEGPYSACYSEAHRHLSCSLMLM